MKWFKQVVGAFAVVSVLGFSMQIPVAEAKSYKSSRSVVSSPKRSSYRPKAVVSKPRTAARTVPRSSVYTSPARSRAPASVSRSRAVRPSNTTVIQKNYYGGGNGGGYNGGGYGGGMGGGPGLGTSILGGAAGAVGGMMLYDAFTEDEGEKALKLQQEQKLVQDAKDQQERDDKMTQIEENQQRIMEEQREHIPEPSNDFFKIDPANQ